jgi:hypothetical protein
LFRIPFRSTVGKGFTVRENVSHLDIGKQFTIDLGGSLYLLLGRDDKDTSKGKQQRYKFFHASKVNENGKGGTSNVKRNSFHISRLTFDGRSLTYRNQDPRIPLPHALAHD